MKTMKKWFPWLTLGAVLAVPAMAWAATSGVTGCCPFC